MKERSLTRLGGAGLIVFGIGIVIFALAFHP